MAPGAVLKFIFLIIVDYGDCSDCGNYGNDKISGGLYSPAALVVLWKW